MLKKIFYLSGKDPRVYQESPHEECSFITTLPVVDATPGSKDCRPVLGPPTGRRGTCSGGLVKST